MRETSSCVICRLRKKRCIVPRPGSPCTLCVAKKLSCSLEGRTPRTIAHGSTTTKDLVSIRPQPVSSPTLFVGGSPAESSTGSVREVLGQELCDDLVDLYFDLIDNKQLLLFHRHSFVTDQRAGRVPEYILLGIVALVARFSEHAYFSSAKPWDRSQVWLRRAIQSFNNRSELISIPALQGCLMLSFAFAVEGDSAHETLLNAQAVRMVLWLHLPERLSSEPVQREVEIRLFWVNRMMDQWHCARARLPSQLSTVTTNLTPLEEVAFMNIRREEAQASSSTAGNIDHRLRDRSIWSTMLPLCEIHNQVMVLNDDIINQPLSQFEIRNKVEVLTIKLDHWLRNLPPHLHNTPENQKPYADLGLAREFAIPHLVYHHNAQLLYYQFLNKGTIPSQQHVTDPTSIEYATRCKAHAAALSELMWNTNSVLGQACLWSPVNGHLLVVASSIHLHSLLFDTNEHRIAHVKQLLEHNFIMLLQFRRYWPTLEFSMSRLRAFHRACHVNSAQESFDMDRWMIEFLQRYNKPVGDRFPEADKELLDLRDSPYSDSTVDVEFWQQEFVSSAAR